MKEFFGITDSNYKFEIFDITTIMTILNVSLILAGWHYAPVFGIINSIIFIILNINNHAHINTYVTQLALIILNVYFLK